LPSRTHTLADAVRRLEADLAGGRAAPTLEGSVGEAAKGFAEEAVRLALDAVRGDRAAIAAEAAGLLHGFVVLLDRLGVGSEEVWAELARLRAAPGGPAARSPGRAEAS
jgi:phosphoribosyl-ATP pyrophosphohydrolase